ncbi:hypothetical protein Bca4012_097692 [Brassica carinata]
MNDEIFVNQSTYMSRTWIYYDEDWVGCVDDRKSTSGSCFYLGNNMVSWHNMKQKCLFLSIAEAEFVEVTAHSFYL